MRLLSALLLALIVSTFTACAQRANPAKSAAKTTKAKPGKKTTAKAQAAPVIAFKKTPCYGPCPDYDATIFADGRVTYEGRSNVKMLGTHELKLPAATVKKILADAQSLGFDKLNNQYAPKNVTDLPTTFLSIRQPDGSLKTVETVQADGAVPAALQALLDYISQELDKISGNTAPAGQ